MHILFRFGNFDLRRLTDKEEIKLGKSFYFFLFLSLFLLFERDEYCIFCGANDTPSSRVPIMRIVKQPLKCDFIDESQTGRHENLFWINLILVETSCRSFKIQTRRNDNKSLSLLSFVGRQKSSCWLCVFRCHDRS